MDAPNFRTVEPWAMDIALEKWHQGEDLDVMTFMSNQTGLVFVADNLHLLIKRGTYEECLLSAYTGCRVNWSGQSLHGLAFMFRIANREKLLSLGDPLPLGSHLTVFRGVAGIGRARRVRGLSWTADPHCAAWFAARFVKTGMLGDAAVFTITARRDDVLCYVDDRSEQEFLIFPHSGVKPKRVKPFPDPSIWKRKIDEHNAKVNNQPG